MSSSSRRSNEIPKKRGRLDVTNGRRDSERNDRHRTEKSKEVFTPKAEKSKETLAEELKTKEFVYEAKMQIQERMKGLGLPLHQLSAKSDKFNETVLRPDEAIAFAQLHMEKVQRLNEVWKKNFC